MPRVFLLLILFTVPAGLAADELDVMITSPPAGEPVFGEVDFAAELLGDGVAAGVTRVVFRLDGAEVGEAVAPPYGIRVDAGDENREHRFEVEVWGVRPSGVRPTGTGGLLASARLVSPAIPTDLEVDAGLQQLYVTVTEAGRRRLDLSPEDFAIFDDGARQEAVTFARGDVRLTAALLIDASFSMAGPRLRSALGGASVFVREMSPGDEATIWVFSDRLLHRTPLSNDPEQLTAGLDRVSAAGGTALNDHLYMSLKRLEKQQGRRVVVILSDGIDSHSALKMPQVAWLARRSRALVYWIRTGSDVKLSSYYSAWKNPKQFLAEYRLLESSVVDSGGRIVELERLAEAEAAFREILRELREQYVLGYYPTHDRDDGRWHRVLVRVPADLEVRTRAGYVDF